MVDNKRPIPTGSTCVNFVKRFCGTRFVEASWMSNCHSVLEVTRYIVAHNIDESRETLTRLINETLTAQKIPLAPVLLSGLGNFTEHELCVRRLSRDNARCLPRAMKKCHRDSIRAVQVLRHRMEDLEPLIVANPDIFVIHYIRDPRAIASSRTRTNYLMWDKRDRQPVREAQLVCHRMMEDLKQRIKLEKNYPGVFIQTKYEDLITEPLKTAASLYSFIGRVVPKGWPEYAATMMNGTDSGPFGRTISDVRSHIDSWKSRIPSDQQQSMKSFCKDLLIALQYHL